MHVQQKDGTARLILSGLFVILPAVLLGVFAMLCGGVPTLLWGQQIAALAAFAPLVCLRRAVRRVPAAVWPVMLTLVLAAPLLFPAVGGARRWLYLGPLNVHAAMLALPALLVLLSSAASPHPFLLIAAAALCLQPDVSQLAALFLGALPILWTSRKAALRSAASLALLAVLAAVCALRPTSLEPVIYCEGILSMLGGVSPLLTAAGVLSLALVPGSFAILFRQRRSPAALCLAVYYAAVIVFSSGGAYPVPFMGFGLSPIAGFWLALMFSPADRSAPNN